MIQPAKNSKSDDGPTIGPIKRFGRYTLFKKLATGGMAEIWLARQTGLAGFNRFVVIKKILSHLGEEETFVKMFLDEARMSVQLTHPNIVQVYDLGEADNTYFIAMEFISGENLAAIAWRGVKRKNPLSPSFSARVIADACKALHYAHHLKGADGKPLEIVHRDISPQNILVTYEGEVKVVDFGIAKAATKSQHTKTGMLKGKFSYMSPEQCLGNPVDMRSDIFALGIVLYELCTGKRLFKHESELMILEMITKRRITPPSQVAENITPELESIILKALEKDAAERFQTAQDFQIALEDYLRGSGAAAGNSDIAAYMRKLFHDKIEEKQLICEMASRDDFGIGFDDNEPTEGGNAAARRGVPGRTPMPFPSQPGFPPGAGGLPLTQTRHQPGMPYPAGYPQGSQLSPMFQSQSGQLPLVPAQDENLWVPKLVLGLALVVIGLLGTFIWQIMSQPPTEISSVEQAPAGPSKTGKLEINSDPEGALVLVNGETVKLESGEDARTPIEALTRLMYGKTYSIRLKKEGFEDFAEDILMSDATNGKKIHAKLKAIQARVSIEVTGELATHTRVFANNRDLGLGTISDSIDPGTYKITANLDGHVCRANPPQIVAQPGGFATATVRCSKGRSGGSSPSVARAPRNSRPRTTRATNPRPSPPPSPDGCSPLPGELYGNVTIATTPPSEIFVNGKKIGDTPLAKYKLRAGCVVITAKSIVNPSEKVKKKIKVEPNRTTRYKFQLGK